MSKRDSRIILETQENDFSYKRSKSNLNIYLIEYLLFSSFFYNFYNLLSTPCSPRIAKFQN